MTTTHKVSILVGVIGAIAIIAAAVITTSHNQGETENNSASNTGTNYGVVAGKLEVDAPAHFSETHEFIQQSGGQYMLVVHVVADKNTNLPQRLCVQIKSDIAAEPVSRAPIRNVAQATAQFNADTNLECIQNPSSAVSAGFLLLKNPSNLSVSLEY